MIFVVRSILAMVITFGLTGLITFAITHFLQKRKRDRSGKRNIPIFMLTGIALFFIGGVLYFNIYYHADERALSFLISNDKVKVNESDDGYFFDGPGDEQAFIFYPGAKVEASAYSAIMYQLAEHGVDCFLVKMPFNMAMFGREKAGEIMSENSYGEWYIGGHSLGGAMASVYAAAHDKDFSGLILMASYSTAKLNDSMKLLSLVGTRDEVVNRQAYAANKGNWPKNAEEYIINGGNHAGFGDYGAQYGDGTAEISSESQQEQSVKEILELINVKNDTKKEKEI